MYIRRTRFAKREARVFAKKVKSNERNNSLRLALPANENSSPFFALIAKTRPKPPFGIPQAFQPPPQNINIFLVILFRSDSHSMYHIFDALSH